MGWGDMADGRRNHGPIITPTPQRGESARAIEHVVQYSMDAIDMILEVLYAVL